MQTGRSWGVLGELPFIRNPFHSTEASHEITSEAATVTNYDPGWFLMLLTVIPAILAGVISIGVAQLTSRLGYGEYDTTVVLVLGILLIGWIGASLLISTGLLQILAVTLAMAGAFAVTRNVTASSYGWILGVLVLFAAFIGLDALGIYGGVDQTGIPQGRLARHLRVSYSVGLFVFGAIGGKIVQVIQQL